MLNTFRVIFVDQGGRIILNPGGCQYDQTGLDGYYSFDHGQPDGINQQYSYDNRTINEWFMKYGIYPPALINGPLFPPNTSTGLVLLGKTGALMSGAGMTSPGRSEAGEVDLCGSGQNLLPTNPGGQCEFENSISPRPDYMYFRKNRGVTLDLRTPSYFFSENNTKRNINRTKALVFDSNDTPYDLRFDTRPSSPLQDDLDDNPQEIDLETHPDDYPQWIYVGVLGAGGPAGAPIETLIVPGGGFGLGCQFNGLLFGGQRIGLCPVWKDNYQSSIDDTSFPLSWDYGARSIVQPTSSGQDGGRAGVFIRTCSLDLNDDDTRTTLVVRIVEMGKGGVESFNNGDRVFDEETINNDKTTFPSKSARKTKVEIYVAEGDDVELGSDKKLVTIEADGGKAQIIYTTTSPVETDCTNDESRRFFCQTCGPQIVDGDTVNQDCLVNPDPLYSDEVYHNESQIPAPVGYFDLTPPSITITRGDYAIAKGIGVGPESDIRAANPEEGHLFPTSIENRGIIDQVDWFRKAGGIQQTPETVLQTIETTVSPDDDFFGLGSGFVFHGDTKYILEQNLDSNQTIIFNAFSAQLSELPVDPVKVEYFKFNDSTGSYDQLVGNPDDFIDARGQYMALTSNDTSKVKMELTFAPNSYNNIFALTTIDETLGQIDWEFAFNRSSDQLLPPPGAGGRMLATMVDGNGSVNDLGIGNDDSEFPGEFSEGVGGNGGGVFVGWGEEINNAALNIPVENFIESRLPCARWTEIPEVSHDSPFYITLSAEHISGIDRVEFIIDNDETKIVSSKPPHPDTGYPEYMIEIDPQDYEDGRHEVVARVISNDGNMLELSGDPSDIPEDDIRRDLMVRNNDLNSFFFRIEKDGVDVITVGPLGTYPTLDAMFEDLGSSVRGKRVEITGDFVGISQDWGRISGQPRWEQDTNPIVFVASENGATMRGTWRIGDLDGGGLTATSMVFEGIRFKLPYRRGNSPVLWQSDRNNIQLIAWRGCTFVADLDDTTWNQFTTDMGYDPVEDVWKTLGWSHLVGSNPNWYGGIFTINNLYDRISKGPNRVTMSKGDEFRYLTYDCLSQNPGSAFNLTVHNGTTICDNHSSHVDIVQYWSPDVTGELLAQTGPCRNRMFCDITARNYYGQIGQFQGNKVGDTPGQDSNYLEPSEYKDWYLARWDIDGKSDQSLNMYAFKATNWTLEDMTFKDAKIELFGQFTEDPMAGKQWPGFYAKNIITAKWSSGGVTDDGGERKLAAAWWDDAVLQYNDTGYAGGFENWHVVNGGLGGSAYLTSFGPIEWTNTGVELPESEQPVGIVDSNPGTIWVDAEIYPDGILPGSSCGPGLPYCFGAADSPDGCIESYRTVFNDPDTIDLSNVGVPTWNWLNR